MRTLVVFLAQGAMVGRIRHAPGTFGSCLGVAWFYALLATGSLWLFALGCSLSLIASVWICDRAARFLGEPDPGSVVLDEIVAVPVCFASWLVIYHRFHGGWPAATVVLSFPGWLLVVGVFLAFRFFDILKPWPIRQSQQLPGGWGVLVDDLLAAVYVNAVTCAVWWIRGAFTTDGVPGLRISRLCSGLI
jgi:phosphatidylglycerophosphatase A